MKAYFTVAIVTESEILRHGIEAMLRGMRSISARTVPIPAEGAVDAIVEQRPSIIIVDPMAMSANEIADVKRRYRASILVIGTASLPEAYLKVVDGVVSLYDSADKIMRQLKLQLRSVESTGSELTPREQEIVVGVVKGLSNKEIAAEMNLAVNTVMTHRRNIAAKLQIHSPAGLTIYALMNKLVNLEDVAK